MTRAEPRAGLNRPRAGPEGVRVLAARVAWPRARSAIEFKTRTAHSAAHMVRGTGCDVDHLDLAAGEVLPSSAGVYLNVLNSSYACMYL
jgi:hypothetical protein